MLDNDMGDYKLGHYSGRDLRFQCSQCCKQWQVQSSGCLVLMAEKMPECIGRNDILMVNLKAVKRQLNETTETAAVIGHARVDIFIDVVVHAGTTKPFLRLL